MVARKAVSSTLWVQIQPCITKMDDICKRVANALQTEKKTKNVDLLIRTVRTGLGGMVED